MKILGFPFITSPFLLLFPSFSIEFKILNQGHYIRYLSLLILHRCDHLRKEVLYQQRRLSPLLGRLWVMISTPCSLEISMGTRFTSRSMSATCRQRSNQNHHTVLKQYILSRYPDCDTNTATASPLAPPPSPRTRAAIALRVNHYTIVSTKKKTDKRTHETTSLPGKKPEHLQSEYSR